MAQIIGQGPVAVGDSTSIFHTTPYPHRAGETARDTEGNEYLYVNFTATVYYGCLVQITSVNQAAPLLGTANIPYRVGVVVGGSASSVSDYHPTSDHAGWVQIYGVHPGVQTGEASDGGVSATAGGEYYCIPQTSVGTPSGVLALVAPGTALQTSNSSVTGNVIFNMWVVDMAEVTDWDTGLPTTWPGVSGASGPTSVIKGETAGANSSAFIGQTYAVYLNYPYVNGIQAPLVDDTSQ
jgi:hypothetical protein